ncbi:hypothetical protein GE107_15820 [Cohnella sp. CFH 77786]|uniref:hypothetical protein n=1 Tax=Cohnella sp. CFH 77786 TaxID=2662265 RepID=UPI001C60BA38|nr:hypothetical protein [Cohnella sp. CFH 77786]MBW5447526.1 hypothetical protein [Cohnella sp. CFH 77786]
MARFNWKTWLWAPLLLVAAAAAAASPALAASPDFTAYQKTAFDRSVAAADETLGTKLKQQFAEFEALRVSSRDWEQKISDLHYRSADEMAALRKRIPLIDADKIAKLKLTVEQTKKQHQNLFDLYRSANDGLKAARKLKNKTLTALLNAQVESLKLPVLLARQDIKNKDTAYQAAKKAAAAKMKKVRNTLSAVSPVQTRIKAAKSALTAPKDSRWTVWKSFTQSIGKRDAKSAAGFLASVNALSRQIIERQRDIFELESRVADIIRTAEAQLVHPG